MKGILGKKVGMTQIFNAQGEVVPITVIEAGPCFVAQIKTEKRDGYYAVQMAFAETKPSRLTKPEVQHLEKAGLGALRYLREFRLSEEEAAQLKEGEKLTVAVFRVGELVDVTGTSKGKGFQGVMKRHNFKGASMTHGQSDRQRSPGSIGACKTPGRIVKGKRMPGHMGDEQVTVQGLEVVMVDPERNLLAVRGAIPGGKHGLVVVQQARKTREMKKVRR
jgi:large subunit ribosomal protein L3